MAKEELDERIRSAPSEGVQKSKQEIREGLEELRRPAGGPFISGLSAGLDIGFGMLFMAVILTFVDGRGESR
ncbi:hypothetical protein [Halomicrococcus gelatinilyticus]|uniref:hypothetical protein n=1 Tax=Halomicrococcus gelatinilyticus TaxID=1702103 RepID=UPI002E14E81D